MHLELHRKIKNAAPVMPQYPTQQTAQTTQSTNINQLKELKELLDSGIITEEEFNAKKKQLLGL